MPAKNELNTCCIEEKANYSIYAKYKALSVTHILWPFGQIMPQKDIQ